MAQLVLPNTIDTGTAITAAEHQTNYVAIRDLINGQIEGGHSGDTARNLALNTVRAQNQHQTLRYYAATGRELQDGVVNAGDGKVTPGAGLVLNYAAGTAWVTDSGGVIGSGAARTPVSWAGGSVNIAANASGNPRIDQIIATITDVDAATISVLQGTATAAADLTNRTGAAALPASAIRLADVLMPTGFAGPFVAATHVRDRRPWARGALQIISRTAGDYTMASATAAAIDATNLAPRIECSGVPVRVSLHGSMLTAAASHAYLRLLQDGVAVDERQTAFVASAVAQRFPTPAPWVVQPAAGSHTFSVDWRSTAAASLTLLANATNPLVMVVEELVHQVSDNAGA